MSEQERAKIDRFIAWLLEHPEKIPAAEQALDLEQQKPPCAELHQPGTRGFYFTGSEPFLFSVSTVTIFSAVAI